MTDRKKIPTKKENKLRGRDDKTVDDRTTLKQRATALPQATQDRLRAIYESTPPSPLLYWDEEKETIEMTYKDDDDLAKLSLISTFGQENWQLITEHMTALEIAGKRSDDNLETTARRMTADLASIAAIAPKDAIETMFAVQMTATNRLTMIALAELSQLTDNEHKNSAANRATKLMNVYIRQVDSLNKHRGKGQQKMTVEHVHVNEGGQAIVGNVEAGGGNAKK